MAQSASRKHRNSNRASAPSCARPAAISSSSSTSSCSASMPGYRKGVLPRPGRDRGAAQCLWCVLARRADAPGRRDRARRLYRPDRPPQGTDRHARDHGDRYRGDRLLPVLRIHRHLRDDHRADRPADAGFLRRRRTGGVSVYLSEIATPGNRGFYTSFQSSSQQVAIFVAAIIGFILREACPPTPSWIHRRHRQMAHPVLHRLHDHPGYLRVLRRSLEETPEFLAMKKHPTASEVFASAIANWRIVILGMMIAVLTTTMFYFITVYAPGFGKRAQALDIGHPARDASALP